jgi:predicted nucleic acid-binding Zn ribbon protein
MTERPEIECPECHVVPAKKLMSCPNISTRGTKKMAARLHSNHCRESDMRQDLLENHGVEKVAPLQRRTFRSVYDDIKGRGSMVKDQMQAEREQKVAATEKKQREWKKAAQKRAPQRSREIVERRKAEKAAKRKITVTSA